MNLYQVPRELMARYARSGPRYTSYPTAPEWQDNFSHSQALDLIRQTNQTALQPLAVYVHVPFCESLCWYCGCNVKIARNHKVTAPYLAALEKELATVGALVHPERRVSQMHWGGGTPTYLNPSEISKLCALVRQHFTFAADAEISLEVDPRVTTPEHVHTLRQEGFNRLSMGVQDFNPQVQAAVHRGQTLAQTQTLIANARQAGFDSINIDLMYGLPFQTVVSFQDTLQQVGALQPDRIALFNYAHVPWLKPAQKLLPPDSFPSPDEKLTIFEQAIAYLLSHGYVYIGMDHFARPTDELTLAQQSRTLRRNFMGYTTQAGVDLYGFGVSSISEIDGHFLQNEREVPAYEKAMAENGLAIKRGLLITAEDRLRKTVIENLSCNGYVDFVATGQEYGVDFTTHFADELAQCQALAADELIQLTNTDLRVLPRGQVLIRNVCMVWDAYLAKRANQQVFSKTL